MTRFALTCLAVLCTQLIASHAASVTFKDLGTFGDNDFYDPVHRPFDILPKSPEELDPVYSLYTRKNPKEDQRLVYNDNFELTQSHFDGNKKTKVIIHGWIDNPTLGHWMEDMTAEYLSRDDLNVIVVDWSKGNTFPDYVQSVANCRVVGAMTGLLIKNIVEATNATYDSFHLLGHSLGAHIVGYAGKYLKGQLGHITGLDPAGPQFAGLKFHEARLWHTDGKFVESIHSDATPFLHSLTTLGLGMYDTCSHIDIYPNGGKDQPGCEKEKFTEIIIHGLFDGVRKIVACNHMRAVDFYMESINNQKANPKAYMCEDYEQFRAGKCAECGNNNEKCVTMGTGVLDYKERVKDLSYSTGRRFFMTTDSEQPFFKKQYLIEVKLGPNSDQRGKFSMKFTDQDGNTEDLDFQKSEEQLHSSRTYSELFVFSTDPQEITEVEFHWTHLGIIGHLFHAKIHVDDITFIDLSTDRKTKDPKKYVFENPNPQDAIRNDDKVKFTLKN